MTIFILITLFIVMLIAINIIKVSTIDASKEEVEKAINNVMWLLIPLTICMIIAYTTPLWKN